MPALTIQLHGFEQLEKRLSELPKKIENKCFRQALRETGNEVKKRIQAGTPEGGIGTARKSVKNKTRVRRGGAWAVIKHTQRPQLYMRIYEQGSRRQIARPFFSQAVGNFEADASRRFTEALKAAVERNEG